jgi:hypothetical protein
MGAPLTAEDVVRRIAAECAYCRDKRGGLGIDSYNRATVRRAIPGAAATARASVRETSPALSYQWRLGFFMHLTFATPNPLNGLA